MTLCSGAQAPGRAVVWEPCSFCTLPSPTPTEVSNSQLPLGSSLWDPTGTLLVPVLSRGLQILRSSSSRFPSQIFASGMDFLGAPMSEFQMETQSQWSRASSLPVSASPQDGPVLVQEFWWACALSPAWGMRPAQPGASAASQAVGASVSRRICCAKLAGTLTGP